MNSNRAPSVALGLSLSILPSVVLGAGFVEVDRLIAPDFQPGDASGTSIAVEGDTSIVCGERHTGADFFQSGRCQVYHLEAGIWIPTQILEPSFPVYGGRFGRSVAIDGNVIVVGASAGCCIEATDPGRAFVFRRSGDFWLEEAMLLPVNGTDDDFFGSSVAVHGDMIAVGASGDASNGAVYVFRHDATGWPLEEKVLAGNGSVSALGTALAFASADDLLAGSRLGVRAYHRNGHRWQEKQHVLVSVLDFGVALATDGTRLIVGSPSEGPGGAGALYVYEVQSGDWALVQRLTALDSAGRLGGSIALEGDVIVAGASSHDPPAGANAGAAYVFRRTASGWVQSQKLSGSATVAGDSFGISVALDAGNLFVGASEADEDFVNIGEAYVFAPTGSNQPPVANAGPDGTFECAGPGGALVTLDGSGSSDPDGDPLSFAWFENGNPLGVGEVIQLLLPLGAHTIELQVTDGSGATDSDETVRTVVDTQPPVVLVFLDPATLWPPNHRLVDVTATVQLIGVCGASTVTLESLVSSEADDAPGGADGGTTSDIQDALTGTDDRAFLLRAERSSQGDGRTYTATYRVVEISSGAAAIGTDTVFVPRNQGGVTDPIALTVTQTLAGTRLDWTEVPGNPVYNVIRGRLREIVDSGNAYALGSVACVEDGSVDVTTVGWEDAAVPMPGEAFVYFVEYVDDVGVSYGEESAHKPRTVSAGGCP